MSKDVLQRKRVFDAVDATTPQTSDIFTVDKLDYGSIHIVHDPTSTGEFHVYARMSRGQLDGGVNDTFFELNFGEPLAADASGEVQLRFDVVDFVEFYLEWEPTVGVGTITAIPTFKSDGV